MRFTFYQRSGAYDIEFDFNDFARENLFPEDDNVATQFLIDMMRQAGIAEEIVAELPNRIPRDSVTHHGEELHVLHHYAAWCYRLGSKLESRDIRSEFWRLVLELPEVHGSFIQPRAEIALGTCVQAEQLAKVEKKCKNTCRT